MATQKRMYDKMSSEAMQEQARAINDASSLITKLTNFQDAIQDLERAVERVKRILKEPSQNPNAPDKGDYKRRTKKH